MDISCWNRNQMQNHAPLPRRCRSFADDDDDMDDNSQASNNFIHATASEMDYNPTRSVREMIKHYNSAAKAGANLNAARWQRSKKAPVARSLSAVNKFGSEFKGAPMVVKETRKSETPRKANKKSSSTSLENHKDTVHRSPSNSINDSDKVFINETRTQLNSTEGLDGAETNSQLHLASSVESNHEKTSAGSLENSYQPVESSYQSKTTILKTASGVRIIIDIFFDQNQKDMSPTDIVGSRIETNIPQSRILNEFQQQACTRMTTN